MIGVSVRLQRQVSNSSSRPEKRWRFIKLQFIGKVVDISVNMRRSVRTVQKTVEGAQVQDNDKVIDVLHCPTSQDREFLYRAES